MNKKEFVNGIKDGLNKLNIKIWPDMDGPVHFCNDNTPEMFVATSISRVLDSFNIEENVKHIFDQKKGDNFSFYQLVESNLYSKLEDENILDNNGPRIVIRYSTW